MLKGLDFTTAAGDAGDSQLVILTPMEGAKRFYATAADGDGLPAVTYGTAITTSAWTALTAAAETTITPADGHTRIRVVETDSSNKPIAVGDGVLNIG